MNLALRRTTAAILQNFQAMRGEYRQHLQRRLEGTVIDDAIEAALAGAFLYAAEGRRLTPRTLPGICWGFVKHAPLLMAVR